jgi:hypothetical protein
MIQFLIFSVDGVLYQKLNSRAIIIFSLQPVVIFFVLWYLELLKTMYVVQQRGGSSP